MNILILEKSGFGLYDEKCNNYSVFHDRILIWGNFFLIKNQNIPVKFSCKLTKTPTQASKF